MNGHLLSRERKIEEMRWRATTKTNIIFLLKEHKRTAGKGNKTAEH